MPAGAPRCTGRARGRCIRKGLAEPGVRLHGARAPRQRRRLTVISSGSQVPAAAPAMNRAGGTWQHARMTCRSSPGAARPGSARRRDARRCPARGECSPVDASSAALAASRALNVSMLAFSSPSPTPSACLRSCTALLARREARSCQECRADSRHGRGQEVPGVLPLREADDDRAHYQAGELDSAGRSTR